MRRGRRDPKTLHQGDAVDFWRVEAIEPDRLLRLTPEMKLPGRAWLQFEVSGGSARSVIRQTAAFEPHGLAGVLYWYALYPVHSLIFGGMLQGIPRARSAARARRIPSQNAPSARRRGRNRRKRIQGSADIMCRGRFERNASELGHTHCPSHCLEAPGLRNGELTTGGYSMADDLDRDGLENQAKGFGKEAEGKIRNSVGGLTGDTSEQLHGKAEEMKGKAQRKIGEAESDVDNDV